MFEFEQLQGGPTPSIVVQTRTGRSIENSVEPDADERSRQKYALLRRRYGPRWVLRKQACGGYNCYGMVFASRRTAILDDTQIPDILADDRYCAIPANEAVSGDLVFYRRRDDGLLLHSAVILRKDEMGSFYCLSKWDSAMGEDEHHVLHHCWTDHGFDVSLEFWTDRS